MDIRYDPFTDTRYNHWPDSPYFSDYRISPTIKCYDNWSEAASRVWLPYYWPTLRLFRHYLDSAPSGRSLRQLRKIVINRPFTAEVDIKQEKKGKIYRSVNLHYDHYWPLKDLNTYSDEWPNYDSLPCKSQYPSEHFYFVKGKMILYVTYSYSEPRYHRTYRPLSLYYDYYYPNSLFWNSSYWPYYRYLNNFDSARALRLQRIFDDETRLIRAQTASLLKRVHSPVPRLQRSWPLTTILRYDEGLPARLSNDHYIHKLLTTSPKNPRVSYTTYYTEPVKKYIGQGRLSCISYAGDKAFSRRRAATRSFLYEDPLRNDIQLLSFYINKFRDEKKAIQASGGSSAKVPLSASRPSRIFSKPQLLDDPTTEEIKELRVARASRLAKIYSDAPVRELKPIQDEAAILKAKQQQEEERLLAEEKALAAEKAKKEAQAQAKKEEAARKAELARQEQLAAQAAAERAAELERQAELARQEELAKQAEIEKARKLEEERLRQEEQKRLEEEAKAEEERKQLERLEELARQAEEEKEAELARQAEELAELARQEAELAEQAKKAAEAEELARQQAELEELERQEAELAELEAKERELAEAAELAKQEAEVAQQHAEEAEQEAEQAAEEEVPQSDPVEEEAAPEEEQQPEAAPEVELNIETEPEAVDEPAEEPEE